MTGNNNDTVYRLYLYTPSLVAAIIFTVLFGLVTAGHVWRIARHKSYFFIAFAIGGIFETLGYAARAPGHYDAQSLAPYIIQSILILVAPALFAASIYMTLGRVIRTLKAEALSPIRTNWLTKIFVTVDVQCFFLQSAGGGLLARGNDSAGKSLIVAGLFLQLVAFAMFMVALVVFWSRLKNRVADAQDISGTDIDPYLVLRILFISSIIILVRSTVRVIEYLMGRDGYLLRHEWTLYVFDAMLMLLATMILLVWYPVGVKRKRESQDVEIDAIEK